jgi:putative ABC transport system substrate-binding protein
VRRREFIAFLGSAAASSLAAGAQQRTPVIGVLSISPLSVFASNMAAFRDGLSETGYADGQNVAIEHHSVEGRYDRLPALAADLVGRKLVGNVTAALALKNATSTIPIVFVLGDPVADGVVASLARPGGNLTGISLS